MHGRQVGRIAMFGRGLSRRCAVCGEGHLFRGYFVLTECCPHCRFRFERREGQFIGAVGINTIVTFGILLIVLVGGSLLTWPSVAVGPIIGISVVLALSVPLVFLPTSRTLWNAIDLMLAPLEPGEAPGLELVGRRTVEGPVEEATAPADRMPY